MKPVMKVLIQSYAVDDALCHNEKSERHWLRDSGRRTSTVSKCIFSP